MLACKFFVKNVAEGVESKMRAFIIHGCDVTESEGGWGHEVALVYALSEEKAKVLYKGSIEKFNLTGLEIMEVLPTDEEKIALACSYYE